MSTYLRSEQIALANLHYSVSNSFITIAVDFAKNCDIQAVLNKLGSNNSKGAHKLSLHFDKLVGNDLLPIIDIYLNLENTNQANEKNHIGAMAMYGLGESSMPLSENKGAGQHRVFDAGMAFVNASHQPNWSNKQFWLTLIPYQLIPTQAKLNIGQIALYFHEGV